MIQRFPVLALCLLTTLWGVAFFRSGARVEQQMTDQVHGSPGQINNLRVYRIVTAFGSLGPMVACLAVQGVVGGEAGITGMLRLFTIRPPLRYLLLALIPVVASAVVFQAWRTLRPSEAEAAHMGTPDALPPWTSLKQLVRPAFSTAIEWAITEEIAWRGFLLPTLYYSGFSRLQSALLVGAIAAGWQALPFVMGLSNVGRAAGAVGLPIAAATAIPLSIIQTWSQMRTRGSLLLAFVISIAASTAALVLQQPMRTGSDTHRMFFAVLENLVLNILAAPCFISLARDSMKARRRGGHLHAQHGSGSADEKDEDGALARAGKGDSDANLNPGPDTVDGSGDGGLAAGDGASASEGNVDAALAHSNDDNGEDEGEGAAGAADTAAATDTSNSTTGGHAGSGGGRQGQALRKRRAGAEAGTGR